MIESSFTLYKLIILYMLQNVNFPLSNTQISDFILEKEYTNYFHLQEALSELQDTKLIEIEKVRNTSYYHMTEEGSKTLSFFENEISPEFLPAYRPLWCARFLSWRHFPGGHTPCSRSFDFQGSVPVCKNQFTEKRGPFPYIQNVGKTLEIRIFPRLWNRAIMGVITEKR